MSHLYKKTGGVKKLLGNKLTGLLLVFFSSLLFQAANAQSIIVTTTSDAVDGNTASIAALMSTPGGLGISLREAIIAANNEPAGANITINLQAGTYLLTIAGAGENNGATGDLDLNVPVAGTKTVTIQGIDSSTTIIQQSIADRILDIHPINNAGSISVNIAFLRMTGGNITGSGGAILAGRPNDVTVIASCAFSNNTASTNGGAISQSSSLASHNLTILNTTFLSNTGGGTGGAVNYNGVGTVLIAGSRFVNNTITATGGDGGALTTSGGGAGGTYTIERSQFLNNRVLNPTSHGGAISNVNGVSTIQYNRFINNTAATAANGNTLFQSGGSLANTITANNNWWGVNTGPAANDVAVGAAPVTAPVIANWLQLKASASPAGICTGAPSNTTVVTAGFTSNSAGAVIGSGNLQAVVGLPISFTATLGNLSAAQPTIQSSGTATVTFTSNGTAGNATVNAVVDNVPAADATARATITVSGSPTIAGPGQPADVALCGTTTAIFTVTATGAPTLTYQWYKGATPLNNGPLGSATIAGATTATLTITNASAADNANNYNVVVTNACGSVTSNNVSLTVSTPPTVNPPTVTQTSCTVATGTIVVNATGTGTLEYSIDGGGGYQLSNTFAGLAPGNYNIRVRLQSSPSCFTDYSGNPVVILGGIVAPTVNAPTVTQPTCAVSTGTIVVNATGGSTLEYSVDNGGSWQLSNTFGGLTAGNYNIVVRLQSSPSCLTSYSGNPIVITAPLVVPTVNVTGGGQFCAGSTVTLTANATGAASYLWNTAETTPSINVTTQGIYSVTVTSADGCPATASTEVYLADFVFTGTVNASSPTQSARLFRDGVVNTCAVPKVPAAPVAGTFFYSSHTFTNPQSVPVCATVSLYAQCSPTNSNLMAAAYVGSFNPANIHTNYAGDAGLSSGVPASRTTFTVTVPANATMVVVVHETNAGHSGCGNYVITVDMPRVPAGITASPAATVCADTPLTLTASAANTYLWSPGGATTQSINPATTGTYDVTLGYGNFGCTATASQSITVNPLPTVTVTGGGNYCQGTTVTLTANGSAGVTYLWNTGETTSAINVTTQGIYTVTVTSPLGCSASASTEVRIADHIFGGTVDATSPTQNARLFRDGVVNTCAVPKVPVAPVAGTFFYQSHAFTNPQSVPVCATVSLYAQCSPANSNLMVAAYLGSFDPSSIHTNYLGDAGLSSGVPASRTTFTVTIPANATIVVVVHETNTAHSGCGNYVVTVDMPRVPAAIVAVPSTICVGASSTLTASVANSYLWSPGGATTQSISVSPTTTTNYSVTLGYGNFGCTATASQTVTVNPLPAVNTHPSNAIICSNGNTTFTVAATGTAPITYQWQIDQGSGFVDLNNIPPFSGVTTNTLVVTGANTTYNGNSFRAVINSGCGSTNSNAAILTVNPLPTINVGPNNQCAPVLLTATGNSNTYAWSPATALSSTTGATVTASPTVNTTYTVTGTLTATGCQNTATVTVLGTPAPIVVTPAAPVICEGTLTQLSVPISSGTPTVQWSPVTGLFTDAAGTIPYTAGTFLNTVYAGPLTTTTYTVTSTLGTCSATPVTVTVSVNPKPIIAVTPNNQCSPVTLVATGNSNSYSWSPAAGLSATTGASVTATPTVNTVYTVTCTITATGCTNTATATVFATPAAPVITPSSVTICSGATTLLSAAGPGIVWTPVTGLFTDAGATIPYVANTVRNTVYAKPATTATYQATASTPTCISAPTSVVVTVAQPIAITTQPASQSVCQGATVTFSVVATGNLVTYQWQLNTGSGFNNIAGANASSLVLANVATSMNNYQYRVIVTNSCYTVTSNAATLTVAATPTVTATPLTNRICVSDTVLALSGAPAGGTWSGPGVSGNNFIPMATGVGTYTLTYRYTNTAGCSNTATVTAKVEDCPERQILLRDNAVVLFPNPNNGRFFIRVNSTLYNYLGMSVYTASGQLVKKQTFGGLVFGRVIQIDLSNLPGGVYTVHFYYDSGNRTADKAFKVVIGR